MSIILTVILEEFVAGDEVLAQRWGSVSRSLYTLFVPESAAQADHGENRYPRRPEPAVGSR